VKDQPEGLTERALRLALGQGWDLRPDELRYAPVGAGSYHWTARDGRKARWFVAVDDLDGKPWLGDTREDVYAGLGVALDTARWLRDQAGLGFVAAPEPARDGATARRLSPRYAVALYRYIEGRNWEFGQHLPPEARDQLIDRLAALHQVTPPPLVPMARPHLSERDRLEQALGDLGRPWSGGPFSEPARALLAGAAGPTGDLLTSFDRLAGRLAAASGPVITHGEPHPGNVIQTGDGLRLIDWDTVGLAHRSRRPPLLPAPLGPGRPGRLHRRTARRAPGHRRYPRGLAGPERHGHRRHPPGRDLGRWPGAERAGPGGGWPSMRLWVATGTNCWLAWPPSVPTSRSRPMTRATCWSRRGGRWPS
jgi:spectinomycin phosphotransferase